MSAAFTPEQRSRTCTCERKPLHPDIRHEFHRQHCAMWQMVVTPHAMKGWQRKVREEWKRAHAALALARECRAKGGSYWLEQMEEAVNLAIIERDEARADRRLMAKMVVERYSHASPTAKARAIRSGRWTGKTRPTHGNDQIAKVVQS